MFQNGSTMFSGAMTDPAQQPAPHHDTPLDVQHDFEVQKELHQKIRNDPDYDDWEYGTEPLPHEAWVAKQTPQASPEPPAAA
jgi:hypothetical protein